MAEHPGWYLFAWEQELTGELTPFILGRRPLVAVRRHQKIEVFDAICPHRGANLGYGGHLLEDCIVCPFHGRRVHLGGTGADGRPHVGQYPCFQTGDAVFVQLSDDHDHDRGFERAMRDIAESRHILAGFTVPVQVPAETIVENAFDIDHFPTIHGVSRFTDLTMEQHEGGELCVGGALETTRAMTASWQPSTIGRARTRFLARAFSPTLVLSELGPPDESHIVLTGTTPARAGCIARVAFAVRPGEPGGELSPSVVDALIERGRKTFDQDVVVWEHLEVDRPEVLGSRDGGVLAFRQFCSTFIA